MIIKVTSSPWSCDYDDEDEAPPWEYEPDDFVEWVNDVFCESWRDDLELDEALDIVESNNYDVEIWDE